MMLLYIVALVSAHYTNIRFTIDIELATYSSRASFGDVAKVALAVLIAFLLLQLPLWLIRFV